MRPPQFKRLYEVMEINGVKVFAHWSVLLIGAVILFGAISEPGGWIILSPGETFGGALPFAVFVFAKGGQLFSAAFLDGPAQISSSCSGAHRG